MGRDGGLASGMNLHESELAIMMGSHFSEKQSVLGMKHCASKCKLLLSLPFRRNANEGSTFHDMLEDVFSLFESDVFITSSQNEVTSR